MEASALTQAGRKGLLARRSPLLKLQEDEKLVALVRSGNPSAFEAIVDRYEARLLRFCRQMLSSTEDAEDVLQEVFVNSYKAMLADNREINLRPWLYRIARNRCLNHLRKPTADAQESMDLVPVVDAASTHERVHNREEFRQLLDDVGKLPETQRSALLLREMDAMSYEEIAQAMDTTVPSVKSLLVRARISLAEASQARMLTCGEVRVEVAEAAEGLRKASGPVRRHLRDCEECAAFRDQVRSDDKALAALVPAGPLIVLKAFLVSKLGFGGGGGAAAGAGAGGGAAASAGSAGGAGVAASAGAASAAGAAGAALGGGGAAGGLSAIGSAVGGKAVAGVVTAAVITAGAVEVNNEASKTNSSAAQATQSKVVHKGPALAQAQAPPPAPVTVAPLPPAEPAPVAEEEPASPPAEEAAKEDAAPPPVESDETEKDEEAKAPVPIPEEPKTPKSTATVITATGAHPTNSTVVVAVGDPEEGAESTTTESSSTTSSGTKTSSTSESGSSSGSGSGSEESSSNSSATGTTPPATTTPPADDSKTSSTESEEASDPTTETTTASETPADEEDSESAGEASAPSGEGS